LVNGLYATSGLGIGGITTIECSKIYSETLLSLELTGKQGEVMKESMKVAKSLAWRLIPDNIRNKITKGSKFGIHIHCPSASTPKDGPSAGTAITLAILSLFLGKSIKRKYAITGEIDLNGNVLEIGGLESKVEGAKRAGVEFVLCPKQNSDCVRKIREKKNPIEADNFKIIMISTIWEAISYMVNCDSSIIKSLQ